MQIKVNEQRVIKTTGTVRVKEWWILNPEIAYPYLKYEGAQQVYVVGVSPGETILRAYLIRLTVYL